MGHLVVKGHLVGVAHPRVAQQASHRCVALIRTLLCGRIIWTTRTDRENQVGTE